MFKIITFFLPTLFARLFVRVGILHMCGKQFTMNGNMGAYN